MAHPRVPGLLFVNTQQSELAMCLHEGHSYQTRQMRVYSCSDFNVRLLIWMIHAAEAWQQAVLINLGAINADRGV